MYTKLVITTPNQSTLTIDTSDTSSSSKANLLKANPTYTQCINSDEDLQPGQVASAQLMFTTYYHGNQLTKDSTITFFTQQGNDSGWRQMGIFLVNDITKNRDDYTVVAYDKVSKLDKDVSSFLESSTATTLYELYDELCDECGISAYNISFGANTNMGVVPAKLVKPGISGRNIMKYIAEACGRYCSALADGRVGMLRYGGQGNSISIAATLSNSDYSECEIADIPCPTITSIRVDTESGSFYGQGSGTPSNPAEIQYLYNPLFYYQSAEDITSSNCVQNVYEEIHRLGQYYSAKIHLFQDSVINSEVQKVINAGDMIEVDGRRVLVMTKVLSDSGCELSCSGNPTRVPQVVTSSQVIEQTQAQASTGLIWKYHNLLINEDVVRFSNDPIVEDIYFWDGLSTDALPGNHSLLTLLTEIIDELDLRSGEPLSINKGFTVVDGTYHQWNSSYSSTKYRCEIVLDAPFLISDAVTISTNGLNGAYTFTGYKAGQERIQIVNRNNNKIIAEVFATTVTDYFVQNSERYYAYPGETQSWNIEIKVYFNDDLVADSHSDISNEYIEVYLGETDIMVQCKKPGDYRLVIYDRVHPGPAATWELRSVPPEYYGG